MKNLATIRLEPLLQLFPGMRVEQEINDTPRSVSSHHFCRSRPRVRNQPQLVGLSRSACSLLGLSFEEVAADADSALYLSGSTLIEDSQVSH
jgi:hypothetical protein